MNDVVNGNSVAPWYGLDTLSEGSAIFVAPNGLDAGWANTGGQDITFVDSIIEQVEADLCVDQSQRFATGFSYGAGMSYSIACSRAGDFRAVAPIAGGLISGCEGGNDPIAYLGIHGVSDNVLPISGGIELAQKFVTNNGCQAKEIEQVAPGSGQSARTDFEGCSQPVSFISWDGGHSGAPFGTSNPLAPEATWDFFSKLTSTGGASVASSNSTGTASPTGSSEVAASGAPVASGAAGASGAPVASQAPAASAPASGAPATGAPATGGSQAPPSGNPWGQPAGGNPWWGQGQGQANGQWKPWTA